MEDELSHVDGMGRASMVDVGGKALQRRRALAEGFISLNETALEQIRSNSNKKGDVLAAARIAGIQAAKETSRLIPLCHTLMLTKVQVDLELVQGGIAVKCTAQCDGKTGVEMEALTGASVALLTLYDMCKAVDKTMEITGLKLLSKTKESL